MSQSQSQIHIHVGTVHHVSFRVDNMDASLAFYEGLLGCRPIHRPPIPGPRGAWLQAGGTQVHLTEIAPSELLGFPPSEISGFSCHVAFHVDDLDATAAILRDRGLVYQRGAVVEQIFVRDPSGNLIEFSPY